ncbi:MAG: hypothetical protein QOI08_103 [Actinomycetota bacterium]|jgi:hypothetical protein|nr:hypothetical protein [Actinomycetota bacterium]
MSIASRGSFFAGFGKASVGRNGGDDVARRLGVTGLVMEAIPDLHMRVDVRDRNGVEA